MTSQDMRVYIIAKKYYVEHMKQSEIAKDLQTSTMYISRMLKRAEKEGVVIIQVQSPDNIDLKLSSQVKKKFSQLRDVLVVQNGNVDGERVIIGKIAAEYVKSLMYSGCVLGVSWGRTLFEFSRAIEPSDEFNDVKVLQMSGGFLCENQAGMMPSNLVGVVSERMHGTPYFLNAPLIVANKEVRDTLLLNVSIKHLQESAGKMDIALYGLSMLSSNSTMTSVGIINGKDIEELKKAGAIGDVLGYFLDRDGRIVNWSKKECYMGVPLEVAATAKYAIIVATGPEKAPILKVAIEKKYCNTLIISSDLAIKLLEE